MGIRIHKAIGYGFTDFKGPQDERLADPKVVSDVHWYEDTFEEFRDWVLENEEAVVEDLKEYEQPYASLAFYKTDLVKPFKEDRFCNPQIYWEENSRSTILWVPPAKKSQWYRYNDDLDYYQACAEHGLDDCRPKVVDLWEARNRRGLYPYEGAVVKPQYRDKFLSLAAHPEEEVTQNAAFHGMDPDTYNRLTGTYLEGTDPWTEGDLLEHLRNDWTCKIPGSLMLYFQKMPIFSDIKYAYDLRPLYYEWWG